MSDITKITGVPGAVGLTNTAIKPTTPPTTPPPPSAPPKPVTNIAALAKRVVPPEPKNIISGNTADLGKGFLHLVLYSEWNGRKTSTAALFDTPEWVRIIGTRNEEQMQPLRSRGYTYAIAPDASALEWLLRYPEAKWPDWASKPDPDGRRTLILDDATEAVQMLLDDSEVIDGKVVKNKMRTFFAAGKALRDVLIKDTLRKPLNVIVTAMAKAKESPTAPNEEIYGPNLPPAMLELVATEFEYVFYINKSKWKIHTSDSSFRYQTERMDVDNRPAIVQMKRTIQAKCKVDLEDAKKGTVKSEEDMDLQDLWRRITGRGGK